MNRQDVLTNPRMAGQVLRYHTWPVHQRQTVGEHTWQVLRIYEQIWGPVPPEVTHYILWHDAGELVTGDIPFPIKRNNAQLKRAMDFEEAAAVSRMGVGVSTMDLPLEYTRRVQICDMLDVYEFGLVELVMGNRFARPVVAEHGNALDELGRELSEDDAAAVLKYVERMQQRFDFNWVLPKEAKND